MAKGKVLTDREKLYISANKDKMCFSHIALELADLYPEDNHGYRSQATVRRFAQHVEGSSE